MSDVDELVAAIRAVATGGSAVDPKVVESLVQRRTRRGDMPGTDLSALSPRERQVLAEMAGGRNNAAIAASLVVTQ